MENTNQKMVKTGAEELVNRTPTKLEAEKISLDEFDKSQPNNASILKTNNLESAWKVEYCQDCKKKQLIHFAPESHEELAHWECNKCGEEFEVAN